MIKLERSVDVRSTTFDNGMTMTLSNFMSAQLAGFGGEKWRRELMHSLDLMFDLIGLSPADRAYVIAHLSF